MRIPVFGPGLRAKSSFVTAKLMTNMYCEQRPDGEKASIVAYGTPGLNAFMDFGDTPVRGGLEFDQLDLAYVVHRGTLWEINNSGVRVNRGTLATTTGRVSIASNGVQICIVDGVNGYIYNTSTNVFSTIAFGYTIAPVTVTCISRRFVVNTLSTGVTGRFYQSAIDDGLTWNALEYATAESNPDGIVSVWSGNQQLNLLGTQTMEFWGNSGSLDFGFTAIQGSATEWGLAARWSVAKYDNTFACLVKNRMGQVMVAKINGYLPQKISTPDIDTIINAYAATDDATAYSYMLGGHPMYVISFPTGGESWLYDGSTGMWHKIKSNGITRHAGEFGFSFLGNMVIADYSSGKLYKLSKDALTDNGTQIEREIISETIAHPELNRFTVDKLRMDVAVGVGLTSGQGSNPQIGLSVSRDNGKTWGAEMMRPLGPLGQYRTSVEWRNLGNSRNFVFKFRVTDPVPLTVISASVNPDD